MNSGSQKTEIESDGIIEVVSAGSKEVTQKDKPVGEKAPLSLKSEEIVPPIPIQIPSTQLTS